MNYFAQPASVHNKPPRQSSNGIINLPSIQSLPNLIGQFIINSLITLALDKPELSPRELAVTFTDAEGYFVSENSVYRLLKAYDLITSPAFIVMRPPTSSKTRPRPSISDNTLLISWSIR